MQPINPRTGLEERVDPNAGALTPPQTNSSSFLEKAADFFGNMGLAGAYVLNSAQSAVQNFLFKQPSLLILSNEAIFTILSHVTEKKDLLALTSTCITLYDMRDISEVQHRGIRKAEFVIGIEFGKKTVELILAVKNRTLNSSESRAPNTPLLCNSDTEQSYHIERLEKEFYALFKVRCQQLDLKPNNSEILLYAAVAVENLKEKSASLCSEGMGLKLKTTEMNFNSKVFEGFLEAYASQPITKITPESFRTKVNQLEAFFPMNDIASVRAAACRAVCSKANIGEMKQLIAAYLDFDRWNPRVQEFIAAFKDELELCKTRTQDRISALCGPNNFNGIIHDAWVALTNADAALGLALSDLQMQMHALPNAGPPLGMLVGLDMQAAHAALVAANDAYKAAKAEYHKLNAELASLAVWTNGNITGGLLPETEAKLAHFDETAKSEAFRLAAFYTDLCSDMLPSECTPK